MKNTPYRNGNVWTALLAVVLACSVLAVVNNAINARYSGSADLETFLFRFNLNGQPHD